MTPDHLARSTRVHFARRLLDDTDLPITDVTFAAGFGSVRQFNRACREMFRATPGDLRARRRVSDRLVADGGLALRLPFQPPFDWPSIASYLRARSIAGVEHVTADCYRRTVVIDGDPGVLELSPGGPEHLVLHAHLPHWAGLIHVAQRARGIVNLDADVEAASRDLGGDPLVGRLFRDRPGVRPPGAWDPFETGVEAIVGEQAAGRDGPDHAADRGALRHPGPRPAPAGADPHLPAAIGAGRRRARRARPVPVPDGGDPGLLREQSKERAKSCVVPSPLPPGLRS